MWKYAYLIEYHTRSGQLVTTAVNAPSADAARRNWKSAMGTGPVSVTPAEKLYPGEPLIEILTRTGN